MIYASKPEDRPAFIQALRDLADWLEATPEVPVPVAQHPMQVSTFGTDEQRRQDMQDMAAVFESAPADPYGDGTHLEVAKRFGPLKFFVHFSTQAWTDEWREEQRLGKEAMARQKAEQADVIDVESTETCEHDPSPIAPSICRKGCGTQLPVAELPVSPDDVQLMGGKRTEVPA